MKLSPHDSSLDALKLVVDMADVPMVITDEDGGFVFANGHTLDIVGKAEDVCIGKRGLNPRVPHIRFPAPTVQQERQGPCAVHAGRAFL